MAAHVGHCRRTDQLEERHKTTMEDTPVPTSFTRDGGWGRKGKKLMKFTAVRE